MGEYDPVTMEPFDCPICMDDIEPGSGYQFERCGHKYCGACLEGYYEELITKGEVEDIKCPSPSCNVKVTTFDLQFILSASMYNKYQIFLRNSRINKDPTMRWCPNPGCGEAVKRKDEHNLLMVCPKCEYEFCYSCAKAFHPGKTCADASKFSLFGGDFRNRVWKTFHTKPCPNCNVPIAKSSGCNHMTCSHCSHEFCWLCMAQYTPSHFYESGCTQFGSNFNPLTIAKRVVHLPALIRRKFSSSYDEE